MDNELGKEPAAEGLGAKIEGKAEAKVETKARAVLFLVRRPDTSANIVKFEGIHSVKSDSALNGSPKGE